MSEKERDQDRSTDQTEEPIQDPGSDDFEAHRHVDRDAERDDSSGMPNRDDPGRDDPGRDIDWATTSTASRGTTDSMPRLCAVWSNLRRLDSKARKPDS